MKNSNCLILGSGGQLGTMLRYYLRATPKNNVYFQSAKKLDRVSLVWNFEQSNLSELAKFISSQSIKNIVMLWGGRSNSTKADIVELDQINECFNLFHKLRLERVLITSSSAVYDSRSLSYFSEKSPISSEHQYQAKKVQLESLGEQFRYGVTNFCFLRLGNILGADSLTKLYLDASFNDFILNKYTNGFLGRSYLSPSSFSYAVDQLLKCPGKLPGVLNVATIRELYMDQILQGLGVSFNINEVPIAGKNLFLDISEFEKLVQIPAEFMNIDSAIKDLINYRSLNGRTKNHG